MSESTIEISLPLLLPDVGDAGDECLDRLQERLQSHKGILKTHLESGHSPVDVCIHYDPNLISLAGVQRLAGEEGFALSSSHVHQTIPFVGLDSADAADVLASELAKLPSMLHASVSYAAGLIFVAYAPAQLERAEIERTIRRMGARPLDSEPIIPAGREPAAGDAADAGQAGVTGETLARPGATTGQDAPHVARRTSHAAPGASQAPDAVLQPAGEEEEEHGHGAPTFLPGWLQERWTLALIALCGLLLAVGFVGEQWLGLPANIAIIFYILAGAVGGYDVATHAVPSLLRGKFDTDVLMLAAALGAAALGEWAEGAFLLFLFSLGHAGEHYALDRARSAINALGQLMPRTAHVRRGEQIVEEPVDGLALGDIVIIRPGDRIPVDGVVRKGESAVDQSPITGESAPVFKAAQSEVFAGTINQEAALEVEVSRLAKDTTLSRVMRLVAEAQAQQSPTQQFTQRFTAWFVPAVLILVALVAAVPPLVGWLPFSQSFYRAMLLLVAASPCALAIGTPAAVLAGIAQAARNGILIKGGVHLENLGAVQVMAFDKTGTLTEGRFEVTDIVTLDHVNQAELLALSAAVEQHANHPLARAVVQAAQQQGLALPAVEGLENLPGRGVRSQVGGEEVLVGSLKLFDEEIDEGVVRTVESLEAGGKTTMTIRQGGRFLGVLGLADRPRPGVRRILARLQELGVKKLVMLTGDHPAAAQHIAGQVGVTEVKADLLPEQKLETIARLQEEHGLAAMTGDGVNDAPALATAAVGIAMGGAGTAVALETADVALMADDLGKLPFAVGLSRASRAIIRQNLAISLGVIGLLVVSSVLGAIQLGWAVALHEGSTVIVALNALRLLGYRE